MNDFAKALKNFLEKSEQWKASSLATAVGLDNSTIRKILDSGRNPRFDTMQKICSKLGYSIEQFILLFSDPAQDGDRQYARQLRALIDELSPDEIQQMLGFGQGIRAARLDEKE